MFQLGLKLDGILKKKATVQDRLGDDDQPGLYSPRPVAPQPTPHPSTSVFTISSTSRKEQVLLTGAPATPSDAKRKYHDPTPVLSETVAAEEAAIGITDPDMGVILGGGSYKSRLGRSVSSGSVDTIPETTSPAGSCTGALTTLVEHQQARQKSPASTNAMAASASVPLGAIRSRSPSAASHSISSAQDGALDLGTHRSSNASVYPPQCTDRTSSHAEELVLQSRIRRRDQVRTMRVEEAYVMGRPFKEYVATQFITRSGGRTTPAADFRPNPMQYVSALTTSGDYMAVGDRAGHVVVMLRRAMQETQRNALLEVERRKDEAWTGTGATSSRAPVVLPAPRSKDTYEFYASQQVYTSVIDPLSSVEVTPDVSALAFLPQVSPAAYLLTSNEKVPKLYKVMSTRDPCLPFRAVDKMDSKTIGPLTAASRSSTVAMKPVTQYALRHEYNIHTICPLSDSEQFITADDLSVHLWCTEYPDTSIETFDLRPPFEDEPREAIRSVRSFPHEPFLLFLVTSAGHVRVIDIRQTMRWARQTPQTFVNPAREEDGSFSQVTNSLSDCALSPCGRYIAGRDFMTVCVWDIRVAGGHVGSPNTNRHGSCDASSGRWGMVRNWKLHPSVHQNDLETLYQSNLLFERFDVQFMGPTQVCTGGFGSTLYAIDVSAQQSSSPSPVDHSPLSTAADSSAEVQAFHLPSTAGVADIGRAPIHSTTATSTAKEEGSMSLPSEFGTRLTLLSRPVQSLGGTCGMMAICGQVVMQLSYQS